MRHSLKLILALLAFSQVVQATDADSFFLLDVEKECVSTDYLVNHDIKEYKHAPAIIPDGEFVIFDSDKKFVSNLKTIKDLEEKAKKLFTKYEQPNAQQFHEELMNYITPQALISSLESVLEDDKLLDEMASRSYIHVTGFTKIVLVTGPKDKEYKVRLHLWWPNAEKDTTKLVVEDKHAHKWSFASKMYSGSFEDQLYLINDVRPAEKLVYEKFIEKVNTLSKEEQKRVFDSISVIEMSMYGMIRFQKEKFRCSVDKSTILTKEDIMKKFDLSEKDFFDIISVHESYVTLPNISGQYGLKKIGLKHLGFPVVHEIKKGQSYFHHYALAHRLISDPEDMIATLIVTAPPVESAEPYLLMRGEDGEDITKNAPILSKERLISEIKMAIEHFKQLEAKEAKAVH